MKMKTTTDEPSPAPARHGFVHFENSIIDGGGRLLGGAGRIGKASGGISVGYYITGRGNPVILQQTRDGGVEVFVPVSRSLRIDETLAALERYDQGGDPAPGADPSEPPPRS